MAQEDAGPLSLLNQAKYFFLRHISEPEENSLRLVVEEAIMSSDWSSVPIAVPYANLTNPQTLNLYAMVSDNPITFADLDGHGGDEHAGAPTSETNCKPSVLLGTCMTTTSMPVIAGDEQVAAAEKDQAQQQNVDNEAVGKTTVGDLSKVLTNEVGSLSTPKGGDPSELGKGADALANALINNANKAKPNEVAPDTGTASPQLAKAMQAAYTNRANGGADPVHGRTFYGTSHIQPSRLHSRPIGNGRQTVYKHFGPFNDSVGRGRQTYIYIYNDPRH